MILLLPTDLFSLPTEVSPHSPAGVQRTDVHGVVFTRVCPLLFLGTVGGERALQAAVVSVTPLASCRSHGLAGLQLISLKAAEPSWL